VNYQEINTRPEKRVEKQIIDRNKADLISGIGPRDAHNTNESPKKTRYGGRRINTVD